MARAIFEAAIQDAEGDAQNGASVRLYEDDGVTPLGQIIYSTAAGGVTLTQPLTADSLGRLVVYVANGQRVKVSINNGPPTQASIWPDAGALSTKDGVETLTNKTVTGATITGGTTSARDKGAQVINVKAFEATPNTVGVGGSGDYDSVAIEAAIAYLKALSLTLGEARLLTLYFPAGRYNLVRPIDLDGLVGCTIRGSGMDSTCFGITLSGTGANTAAYWSTKSMMSMVGSNFCRLEGFSLTPPNNAACACPEAGLLIASNNSFTNWVGSSIPANISNRNEVYSVRVRGPFTKAAHANVSSVSSIYQSCEFARDKSQNATYPNGTTINQAALVLSRDNEIGMHQSGSVGIIANGSCSDLTFVDVEIHDFCQGSPTATSCVCPAVWIEEGYDMTFLGGNWISSSNTAGYLRLSMGTTGSLTGPRNLVFDNIFWHTEGGIDLPSVGVRLTSNTANTGAVLRSRLEYYPANDSDVFGGSAPSIVASDIVIRNCRMMVQAGGGMLNGGKADGTGGAPANFVRWRVENSTIFDQNSHLNQSDVIIFGGTDTGAFSDCEIDAQGLSIVGNGSTWTRGRLRRPGSVAGFSMTGGGDATITGGGAVSLGTGGTAYYGLASANATEANVVPVRIGHDCKTFNFRAAASAAPSSGSLTVTLRRASPSTGFSFADTSHSFTITSTSVTGAVGSTFVDLTAGDVLTVRVVSAGGATTNAWVTWALEATST